MNWKLFIVNLRRHEISSPLDVTISMYDIESGKTDGGDNETIIQVDLGNESTISYSPFYMGGK